MQAERHTAVRDFRQARKRAGLERLMARLTGKSLDLLPFEHVRRMLRASSMIDRGLREIPLDAIVGSVNRYRDFSRSFLPLFDSDESRWAQVKMAQVSSGLPPITVYQIGDAYFVLDGNHRVSVAKQMGLETIEAYVRQVQTPVPLSPDVEPDDLIVKAEYADFLNQTGLNRLRPEADLSLTAPGRYPLLLEHIQVHHYYLGLEQQQNVPYEEAVTSWYDNVYRPVVEVIQESGILRDFPNRTETDLYVWLAEHRASVEEALGWEVRPAMAVADMQEKAGDYKPIFDLYRVLRAGDTVPLPTRKRWHMTWLAARPGDYLFRNVLVPLRQAERGWWALDQAFIVAQREYGHIRGLYAVEEAAQESTLPVQTLREAFEQRCQTAGVQGELLVEEGTLKEVTCHLARWVDLIVLHVNVAAPVDDLWKLVNTPPAPMLLVQETVTAMQHALLAYDGRPESDAPLAAAAYLAQRWQIALTLLPVAPAGSDAESIRETARQYLRDHDVNVNCLDTVATDAGDIAAATEQSDLILLAAPNTLAIPLLAARPDSPPPLLLF